MTTSPEPPFPVLARVRQAHGGPTVTDPSAPDGVRQCSPYGTVVAYRDGRMGVLHDDAMWRPSDRYSDCRIDDAVFLYRLAAGDAQLTGTDIDLLAAHLNLTEIDALSPPADATEVDTECLTAF